MLNLLISLILFNFVDFFFLSLFFNILKSDQYSFKELFHLEKYKIEESVRRTVNRDTSARWNHMFYLVRKSDSTHMYTFYFRTEDARRKWMKSLQDALLVSLISY